MTKETVASAPRDSRHDPASEIPVVSTVSKTSDRANGVRRFRVLSVLLSVIALLASVLVLEVGLRIYHRLRWDISMLDGQPKEMGGLSPVTMDAALGWRATENYQFDGIRHSSDGQPYRVTISQDRYGFRVLPAAIDRPCILVIGDSFTQAVDVSNEETYSAAVGRLTDSNVLAYGVGGYGTLQEWMVFDHYFDVVKPDLVLWQYATNDFINNSPELETASRINNNGMVRPYLVGGETTYILPKDNANDLRMFALQYCRICYVIMSRLDRLSATRREKTVETETSPSGLAHQAFRRSVEITSEIMARVRKRAGAVPIVAFIAGLGDPYGPEYEEAFRRISQENQIWLLNDVERAVLQAEQTGVMVRAADGAHWNAVGHRLVGEAIAAPLADACMLQLCAPELEQ